MNLRRGRKGLRAKGHKLTLEWSGEYGVEASSTGYCICGWSESASNQEECRHEYRCHLESVIAEQARLEDDLSYGDEPAGWFLEHGRYDDTCRWGPFATFEEAKKWANDRMLSAAIIPLYMNVNWNRRG
jgi:hypothetical protein